ncbi:MAG: 5'-nucleotidase C-terminal domain-containing protein, partial [Gemmatimonadota bacterium]|nr:5'-nucleotidase C-terminal domain-containing protein [Gemmatimonadota bacterium]
MLSTALALAVLAAAPFSQDTAHVVVVATTDVHGRATHWDYLSDTPGPGGLARAATVVDSLRRVHPGQVVLVDAGDLIQGDPFAAYFAQVAPRDPHPIIDAMNAMGYDAVAPGNHEYNWGLPVLRRAVAGAAFPFLAANTFGLPGDTLMFEATTVVRRGPVRIGIAGFTTPGVMVWDRENVRGRARVAPVGEVAPETIRELDAASDFTVAVIHSGMDGPASYDTTGVGDEDVAATFAALPVKPDLVVVGHSHREMRDSVIAGVHFVQPKYWAQSLSVMHVDLVRDGRGWRPVRWRGELIPLRDVPPSPVVMRRLQTDHEAVRRWVADPIGQTPDLMSAKMGRAGPTPIIELIQRVQRERTGAELSSTAAFNLEAELGPGAIRLGDVAELYPYENTLRAIRISGAQLRAYLEQSARYFEVDANGRVSLSDSIPGYNFDIVSGAEYAIDLSRSPGRRIRDLTVRGKPVAPADTFTLALNNYRQGGGGGFAMLRRAPLVYDRGENIRDLLVAAIRRRGTIRASELESDHWRIVPETAAAQVRRLFGEAAPPPPRVRQDSILLRVLTTNDFHGALLPREYEWARGRPVGGAVAVDAVMDSLEAACDCPAIRVDAGDQFQGTLVSSTRAGKPVIEFFNRMGLAAAAVGNHDFDWSVDTLRARMADAQYPWLVANVFDSATGRRPDWARPWVMVRRDTLDIAIIGYIGPETRGSIRQDYVKGLEFRAAPDAIRDVLTDVARAGPDVTILLAHEGAECSGDTCRGEVLDLARSLSRAGVDLIVGGHRHEHVETTVADVPIVIARSSGTAVGVADLRRTNARPAFRTDVLTVWADSIRPDSGVARLIEAERRRVEAISGRVVARLRYPLDRDGSEYPLGNLIADARRN